MKKLRTVELEWEEFSRHVFRGFAPSDTQRAEMKKAFYGGFSSLMFQIMRIGEKDIPDEVGVEHLENLRAELQSFKDEMA